jgi:hypothetical protein
MDPSMTFPYGMTTNQIVDKRTTQPQPLAERSYTPEIVEISAEYAAQLDLTLRSCATTPW